jgi:hypothetical protein
MLFAVNLFQHQTIKTMAKPIKETPTLTGKDAERFFQRMENIEKVSAEEVARIKHNASKHVFVFQ